MKRTAYILPVACFALLFAMPASAAYYKSNPDHLPSLTLFGGMSSASGDWTTTSGDPGQEAEDEAKSIGAQFKIPVSETLTFFVSASRGTSTNKGVENTYYYGTRTEWSGWSLNGGITIYFGGE